MHCYEDDHKYSDSDAEGGSGFIFIGTPMPKVKNPDSKILSVPAKLSKSCQGSSSAVTSYRPVPLHEQRVLDERGRPLRFHGAFTGGFSAGYFNSVGTQEGFVPQEFKSTRSDRNKSNKVDDDKKKDEIKRKFSRPEDFMDAEDLGEDGIAPREVRVHSMFDDAEVRGHAKKMMNSEMIEKRGAGCLDAKNSLLEVIVPRSLPIGEQLMRKFGWRKYNENTKSKEQHFYFLDYFTVHQDTFGLGYKGLDSTKSVLGITSHSTMASNRFLPPALVAKSRDLKQHHRITTMPGFGVGALEREDADIYEHDDMSNYDFAIGDIDQSMDDNIITQQGKCKPNIYGSNSDKILSGFCLSNLKSQSCKSYNLYSLPNLPSDFIPVHKRVDQEVKITPIGTSKNQMTSSKRAILLGASVLDIIPPAEKQKLQEVSAAMDLKQKAVTSSLVTEKSDYLFNKSASTVSGSILINKRVAISQINPNNEDVSGNKKQQSRWDLDQKQLEDHSIKNVLSQQNICLNLFKSRFVKASDDGGLNEIPRVGLSLQNTDDVNSAAKVMDNKNNDVSMETCRDKEMITNVVLSGFRTKTNRENELDELVSKRLWGAATRLISDWYPNSVLCKRFNVPVPYLQSTNTDKQNKSLITTGILKTNDFSIFNFLPASTVSKPSNSQQESCINKSVETPEVFSSITQESLPLISTINTSISVTNLDGANSQVADLNFTDVEDKPRPAMDLFKSIFQPSDDSDNDNETDNDVFISNKETVKDSKITRNTEQLQVMSNRASDLFKHLFTTDNIINNDKKKVVDLDVYGPPLPPAIIDLTDSNDDRLSSSLITKRHNTKGYDNGNDELEWVEDTNGVLELKHETLSSITNASKHHHHHHKKKKKKKMKH